jgi:hypothetical protein
MSAHAASATDGLPGLAEQSPHRILGGLVDIGLQIRKLPAIKNMAIQTTSGEN